MNKVLRLNATNLKVKIERFVLRKVEELFIDLFAWNEFKTRYIDHYFVDQHSICWKDESFYERKLNNDLLTVNQTPKLTKRSFQTNTQYKSGTQNYCCYYLYVIANISKCLYLFFRTELRRK